MSRIATEMRRVPDGVVHVLGGSGAHHNPPRTEESNTMPTRNPYDRRHSATPGYTDFADGRGMVGQALRLEGPDGAIALEDLSAMVGSAVARALRVEREEASIQQSEVVRDAQRSAWDEGHEAGRADGRSDLLWELDARFGEQVRAAHRDGMDVLWRMREPRKVPKADLERSLDNLVHMLRKLMEGLSPR